MEEDSATDLPGVAPLIRVLSGQPCLDRRANGARIPLTSAIVRQIGGHRVEQGPSSPGQRWFPAAKPLQHPGRGEQHGGTRYPDQVLLHVRRYYGCDGAVVVGS